MSILRHFYVFSKPLFLLYCTRSPLGDMCHSFHNVGTVFRILRFDRFFHNSHKWYRAGVYDRLLGILPEKRRYHEELWTKDRDYKVFAIWTKIPSSCILYLYLFLLPLKVILILRFRAYGRTAFILSSDFHILLHSGNSRFKWIASNSHCTVHRPHPIHLFGSTTDAPHPKQRAASVLICSSGTGQEIRSI